MMKKLYYLIIVSLVFSSCEDVIDLEVPNAPPRLVIEASINWFEGTIGNQQEIKLTLTAPYFDDEIPPANGAVVTIKNTDNTVFNFIEEASTGIYKNTNFSPELNENYTLTITYDGETYTASENLEPVTPIDFIEQKNDGGFSGEDIEVKAFYTDPANEANYYFYEFINSDISELPSLEVYDDEFSDGNQIFAFYSEEDLEAGQELIIRNYGASERFYEFMFILLQQNGDGGGGPFETQPATVRGNCINQTNRDNYPFGYFRVSQANEFRYIIE